MLAVRYAYQMGLGCLAGQVAHLLCWRTGQRTAERGEGEGRGGEGRACRARRREEAKTAGSARGDGGCCGRTCSRRRGLRTPRSGLPAAFRAAPSSRRRHGHRRPRPTRPRPPGRSSAEPARTTLRRARILSRVDQCDAIEISHSTRAETRTWSGGGGGGPAQLAALDLPAAVRPAADRSSPGLRRLAALPPLELVLLQLRQPALDPPLERCNGCRGAGELGGRPKPIGLLTVRRPDPTATHRSMTATHTLTERLQAT